jgi:hypothetical protein
MVQRSRTTQPCDQKTRAGRLAKAKQFSDAADIIESITDGAVDVEDAYITMCVHAGIAAADVICCAQLGEHSWGDDHDAAVRLLAKVDTSMSRHLNTLLRMKTRAGYSAQPSSGADRKRAGRAAGALVEYASGLP